MYERLAPEYGRTKDPFLMTGVLTGDSSSGLPAAQQVAPPHRGHVGVLLKLKGYI